jgi:hypothetical protein
VDKEKWQEILEKAKRELFKSLDKFGPSEVLGLLVIHSHNDPVVYDLLTRFPTVVALGEFLSTLPVVRMDERIQEDCQREEQSTSLRRTS